MFTLGGVQYTEGYLDKCGRRSLGKRLNLYGSPGVPLFSTEGLAFLFYMLIFFLVFWKRASASNDCIAVVAISKGLQVLE